MILSFVRACVWETVIGTIMQDTFRQERDFSCRSKNLMGEEKFGGI